MTSKNTAKKTEDQNLEKDAAKTGKPDPEAVDEAAENLAEPEQVDPEAGEEGIAGEAPADPGQARIAELEGEVAKLKDQLLRALAEAENVRRRAERDKQETAKYAAVPLARDLLGVADNLRRALEHEPKDLAEENDNLGQFVAGVEMTERELMSAFSKHGIEAIQPEGERFDPDWHEAMFEVPDESVPAGTVMQVVQTGYRIGERLLRPARVGVSRGGPKPARKEAQNGAQNGAKDGG